MFSKKTESETEIIFLVHDLKNTCLSLILAENPISTKKLRKQYKSQEWLNYELFQNAIPE